VSSVPVDAQLIIKYILLIYSRHFGDESFPLPGRDRSQTECNNKSNMITGVGYSEGLAQGRRQELLFRGSKNSGSLGGRGIPPPP